MECNYVKAKYFFLLDTTKNVQNIVKEGLHKMFRYTSIQPKLLYLSWVSKNEGWLLTPETLFLSNMPLFLYRRGPLECWGAIDCTDFGTLPVLCTFCQKFTGNRSFKKPF